MEVLNKPPKPFAWSFSAVDNFHTCGKKYYHQNIAKDVSDDTTFRNEGQKIHQIMANALDGAPLPDHLKHWNRWLEELWNGTTDDVELHAEQKMAFTTDFEPCTYFDKVMKPWCRTVIDVLKVKGDKAKVWDWKTGKIKPDVDQLMLCSTAVFVHYPGVKEIDAALIFLKEDKGPHIPRNNCTHEIRVRRDDLPFFWGRYIHKVNALERAVLTDEWNPTPSGLCRNHCPVRSCAHNGHYGE
jgi:hypothetical protein